MIRSVLRKGRDSIIRLCLDHLVRILFDERGVDIRLQASVLVIRVELVEFSAIQWPVHFTSGPMQRIESFSAKVIGHERQKVVLRCSTGPVRRVLEDHVLNAPVAKEFAR